MADVDTSIYNKFLPPPTAMDPLKTFGQVVGIQNAQQQNKLMQQQTDMRAGLTSAYQAAVDPTTGQVDQNKLLALSGQDPRTAGFFGDINSQAQANAQATAQAQKAQLENGIAHIQAVNAAGTALMSNKALGVTDLHDQIAQSILDLSNHGDSLMTGKIAQATIASIPTDPAGQLQWVQQKMAENDAYAGKFKDTYERTFGASGAASSGATLLGTKQDLRTGALSTQPQQGVPLVVGPEMAGSKVDWTDTSGQVHQGTYAQYATEHGMGRVVGAQRPLAGATPAAQPPVAGQPSAAGASPAPKAGVPPTTAKTAPVAPPQAQQNGYVSTPGPTPGLAVNQAQYYTDLAAVKDHATNVQSLDKARVALDALAGPLGTGKGTDTLAGLKSVLSSLGIGFDDSTLNHDLAKKYLLNYAKTQGAAAHSDEQLNAALGSNASTDISNKAALDVVKTNIGRENQAIASVMEQDDKSGAGHIARAAKFATDTDPHAFAWNRYTPEEQQKYVAGLDAAGKAKFAKSLTIAGKHGLIQPEGPNASQ